MKLYYHPLSPYSQKALITVGEFGCDVELELTNLFDPETRARYRAEVAPLGKIPLLVTDDGGRIAESTHILEYLDQHAPLDPPLIPTDRDQARQARYYDRVGDLYLIDKAAFLFFELRKPEGQRDEAGVERARDQARLALNLLERALEGQDYLVAGRFTMGDIASGVGVASLTGVGFDLSDYPNLRAWQGRLSERPVWQEVRKQAMAALS